VDSATRAAAMMTACGRSAAKKLANGELVGQIEFTVRSKHEIGMALLLKGPDDGRTHQAAVSGHIDSRGCG